MSDSLNQDLPNIVGPVPGPRSQQLAADLRRWECPNITYIDERFPVFWESAAGCLVRDVDGSTFLDLTSAFGPASVGHCRPRVVEAIQRQAARLIHGMGDVHPSALKIDLARRLAEIAPGDLQQVIFGSDGADAVEAAMKTAILATGKPGILAFEGAYHGLTFGALALTARPHFRSPFEAWLKGPVERIPYPDPTPESGARALNAVDAALKRRTDVGAVILEPIQGRGGIRVPPPGWFSSLKAVCRSRDVLLIADEILTGCGRTGAWFASEVAPDLLCIGKAMAGGFPISACIGSADLMSAWGASTGEAIHTSTFLGSPLGCAAALAALDTIQQDQLIPRVCAAGVRLRRGLEAIQARRPLLREVRGRGLMLGIELVHSDGTPHPAAAVEVMIGALNRGVILLPAGDEGNIIELLPPYIITDAQIDFSLAVLDEVLSGIACPT